MIDLSKKKSNKNNHYKKLNIKDTFSDNKNISDPLGMSNSLSSSLSDIEKITKRAQIFKSRFVKCFYFLLFILLIYIIYKIYVSLIKKKPLVKSDFDIEKDIQTLLDNFK